MFQSEDLREGDVSDVQVFISTREKRRALTKAVRVGI
jgi:hypothetical protein